MSTTGPQQSMFKFQFCKTPGVWDSGGSVKLEEASTRPVWAETSCDDCCPLRSAAETTQLRKEL